MWSRPGKHCVRQGRVASCVRSGRYGASRINRNGTASIVFHRAKWPQSFQYECAGSMIIMANLAHNIMAIEKPMQIQRQGALEQTPYGDLGFPRGQDIRSWILVLTMASDS